MVLILNEFVFFERTMTVKNLKTKEQKPQKNGMTLKKPTKIINFDKNINSLNNNDCKKFEN